MKKKVEYVKLHNPSYIKNLVEKTRLKLIFGKNKNENLFVVGIKRKKHPGKTADDKNNYRRIKNAQVFYKSCKAYSFKGKI